MERVTMFRCDELRLSITAGTCLARQAKKMGDGKTPMYRPCGQRHGPNGQTPCGQGRSVLVALARTKQERVPPTAAEDRRASASELERKTPPPPREIAPGATVVRASAGPTTPPPFKPPKAEAPVRAPAPVRVVDPPRLPVPNPPPPAPPPGPRPVGRAPKTPDLPSPTVRRDRLRAYLAEGHATTADIRRMFSFYGDVNGEPRIYADLAQLGAKRVGGLKSAWYVPDAPAAQPAEADEPAPTAVPEPENAPTGTPDDVEPVPEAPAPVEKPAEPPAAPPDHAKVADAARRRTLVATFQSLVWGVVDVAELERAVSPEGLAAIAEVDALRERLKAADAVASGTRGQNTSLRTQLDEAKARIAAYEGEPIDVEKASDGEVAQFVGEYHRRRALQRLTG
jgi:hypothetical protein